MKKLTDSLYIIHTFEPQVPNTPYFYVYGALQPNGRWIYIYGVDTSVNIGSQPDFETIDECQKMFIEDCMA